MFKKLNPSKNKKSIKVCPWASEVGRIRSEVNSREFVLSDFKMLTPKMLVSLSFFEGLEGLERSGRLVGRIPTNFHQIHASGDVVMIKAQNSSTLPTLDFAQKE